jgi:hypothetical protein
MSYFTLVPVSEESVPLLARWLSDPRVLEFYEGRDSPHDEDMVRTHFFSPDEYMERFIVHHSERPIGYLQLYPVAPAMRPFYGVGEDEAPFGMDLFIGEPALWVGGSGRGSSARLRGTLWLNEERRGCSSTRTRGTPAPSARTRRPDSRRRGSSRNTSYTRVRCRTCG